MSPSKPLRGIKILDLSRLLPGPFCSHLLSEWGASVTVIEPPNEKEVLHFPSVHQRKKRKILNLKESKDILKFKALVKKSQVILEGFRPGVLDRLGIGFQTLRKINPKIILCSLTGYGQKGGDHAGHDLNFLSLSGMLSALAAGKTPSIPGIPLADLLGGTAAASEILAALTVPPSRRKALHLDVSIDEATRRFLLPISGGVQESLKPVFSGGLARYFLYETQEGAQLAVAPLEEKFWIKFTQKMKIPGEVLSRGEGETLRWLKERFRTKTQEEWMKILNDPDLCVTPVVPFQ